jgi:hypothetical protein
MPLMAWSEAEDVGIQPHKGMSVAPQELLRGEDKGGRYKAPSPWMPFLLPLCLDQHLAAIEGAHSRFPVNLLIPCLLPRLPLSCGSCALGRSSLSMGHRA